MTDIQLKTIEAINQQAINISKSNTLHFEPTCQIYRETLNIQFLILANQLNIEEAQKVLLEGKKVFDRESEVALKMVKESKAQRDILNRKQ